MIGTVSIPAAGRIGNERLNEHPDRGSRIFWAPEGYCHPTYHQKGVLGIRGLMNTQIGAAWYCGHQKVNDTPVAG